MGVVDSLKAGGSKVLGFGRAILSPVIGAGQLLMLPITVPWRLTKWGAKKGWMFGVKPGLHGAEYATGVGREVGGGTWDMTRKPAWALTSSCGYVIKGNLWVLPGKVMGFVKRAPGNAISTIKAWAATPIRLAQSTRDAVKNIPGATMNWIKSVPMAKLGSTITATRKAYHDVFKNPFLHTVKPMYEKWTKEIYDLGHALVYPELQLATVGIPNFYYGIGQGAMRISNAPNHTHKWKWLENIEGKWLKPKEDKPTGEEPPKEDKPKEDKPKKEKKPTAPAPAGGGGGGGGDHGHTPAHH